MKLRIRAVGETAVLKTITMSITDATGKASTTYPSDTWTTPVIRRRSRDYFQRRRYPDVV